MQKVSDHRHIRSGQKPAMSQLRAEGAGMLQIPIHVKSAIGGHTCNGRGATPTRDGAMRHV